MENYIKTSPLPEAERHNAHLLNSHLASLDRHIIDFNSAIKLLQFSRTISGDIMENRRRYRDEVPAISNFDISSRMSKLNSMRDEARLIGRWEHFAAQHAAVNACQVIDRINEIEKNAVKLKSLKHDIKFKRLEEAKIYFREKFPDYKDVRDGYAHEVHKSFFNEDIEKHSKGQGAFLSNVLIDDTLTHTVYGKTVRLGVNEQSASNLIHTRSIILSAFEKIFTSYTEFGG